MTDTTIVLLLFIVLYTYFIFFKHHRAPVLWGGIALMFLLGIVNLEHFTKFINWNVLGIFAGTLIIAEFFTYSKVPAYLADHIVGSSKHTGAAMLRVCAMSGFLSIFVENVAVVLIVAPIALEITRKLKVSPVAVIIGVAISSNLQGMAILIGDPPAMILAAFMRMNFNDFFLYKGHPGLFFTVEIAAVASLCVLYLFFRKDRQKIKREFHESVTTWLPTIVLVLMIVLLSFAPIFDPDFNWLSGVICLVCALFTVVWSIFFNGKTETFGMLKKFEVDTTFFLAGIFVLVGIFELVGLMDALTTFLTGTLGNNIVVNYLFIVLFSVLASAVIDNVPFVTVMIPVTHQMGQALGGSEILLMYGLLIGACLGGNISPIGAAANIVAVGILKKEGNPISFMDFVKIGLPFTIAATIAGAIFNWLVWS